MSKYTEAKIEDPVGVSVLTRQGAAELNAYRGGVAQGRRPTVSEIASAVLAGVLKKGGQIPNGSVGRALRMERADSEIYPGRKPWILGMVDGWLANVTKKKG